MPYQAPQCWGTPRSPCTWAAPPAPTSTPAFASASAADADADDDDDDARSNSIDSFAPNNIVMCRYYSISRFEVGSDGNGDRSERREGYPQPLLRPASNQLTEEPLNQ